MQLDGDLTDDPIAQAMSCRVKQIGGLDGKATEVDAKKSNYPVSKAPKLPAIKSAAIQDISLPSKNSEVAESP
jgi:hypothetical protein